MKTHDRARSALAAYREARPNNLYVDDPFLQRALQRYVDADLLAAERPTLERFGAECAGAIDQLAQETNRDEHLPQLRRWDGLGHRREEVIFHPGYDEIGRLLYRTGIISKYATPGQEALQLAYGFLLGQNGEAGHLCPAACTAGLVKILQQRAPEWVAERFLPGLLRDDRLHPDHHHAAQFLTEVQGGSDVGANACVAVPDGDLWRVSGEKWFCSVIDADLYLVTARPEGALEGTQGLAAFVIPRLLEDGSPNGLTIRRLKYKLGTRSMASGEADFDGALAWPISVDGGFKAVVEIVLNTSRLYNAIASCGMMRRVEIEVEAFADHREAFGRPIRRFPLVQRTLERIQMETRAGVAGTFALAALGDKIARGEGDDEDKAVYRLVVNMNKYWTSLRSSAVIHDGIEIFGGNGAIEDFSVLPRLYRDAIVCESWEGTHNVLCAQVLKDLLRYRLHEPFFAQVERRASRYEASEDLLARLKVDREMTDRALGAPIEDASWMVRPLVDRLAVTWQSLCLLELGEGKTLARLLQSSRGQSLNF